MSWGRVEAVRPPLLAATCDEVSAGAAEGVAVVVEGAGAAGGGLATAEPPPGDAAVGAWAGGNVPVAAVAPPPAAEAAPAGASEPPGLEPCSTAGGALAGGGEPGGVGARGGVPATTERGPMGIVEKSSSLKKSRVAGSEGEVDITEKGNMDSSNTTCREMIIRLECKSRQRYPLWSDE